MATKTNKNGNRFYSDDIVLAPDPLAQLVEQAGGLQNRSGGFHDKFIPVRSNKIFARKPACKRIEEV